MDKYIVNFVSSVYLDNLLIDHIAQYYIVVVFDYDHLLQSKKRQL